MSDNKGNINSSIGKTLDYLRDMFGGRERNAMERNLARDLFEREAMEGFQSLKPDDVEGDLKELNKRLSRRVKRSNRILVYRMAAGIAVILTLSISYLIVFDKQIDEFPENLQVSERVEKEVKAVDKAIEVPTETSSQEELGYIEYDLSDSEIIPNETESTLENTQTIISAEDKADLDIASLEETIVAEDDENLAEFSIEFDEENEVAMTEETLEALAFQSNAKEGTSKKDEEASQPIAEVFETEFAMQKSASRSKKSVASPSVSQEASAVTADELSSPILSISSSDYVLKEVVIGDPEEEKETDETIPASPEIGKRKYRKYIEENIRIPAANQEIQTDVLVLKFIINEKGMAEQFKIIESPDTTFSTEAIRLVEEGPVWFPAKRLDQYSPEETMLKMVFKK